MNRVVGAVFASAVYALACIMATVPVVRADSPPAVELYGTLPKTENLRLSPNGEFYAAILTVKDTRLLVIAKGGNNVLFSGNVAEIKVGGVEWAGNDHVIVYTHTTANIDWNDPEEFSQALVINVSTGKAAPLIGKSDSYFPAIFGHYGFAEEDGVWYAFVGVVPMERSRDTAAGPRFKQYFPNLYKVNLDTGELTLVAKGSTGRRWVLDEKGAIVARSEYSDKNRTWKILPPDSLDVIAAGEADYGFGLVGLGRTPGTILFSTGGADDSIVELRLDTKAQEVLLPGGTDLIHSSQSRLLLGAIQPDGKRRMELYDPLLDRRFASIRRAFKDASSLSLTSLSANFDRVVVFVESDGVPGVWQAVDFKTGRAEPIADMYPGIPSAMVGPTKMYAYKASDGLAMEGVLTLPPGVDAKNLPVIVMPHGGPESADSRGFHPWAQVFAARGYAVFQPNFRGSGDYGVEFRNAGFGQWGRKMQTDISDGLTALAADGIVDAKRACIVGGSYGGYAALAGVTLQQGLYRCAASLGGVSDPGDMLRQDARDGATKAARRYWHAYLGEHIPDNISPLENAANADAPILLVHGEKDTVVSPQQSKDMEAALLRAGKSVTYIELKNEDHWLSRSATRLQWFQAMVAFVQKHNPP